MAEDRDRLLTTAELARRLAMSERTIQRYRASGDLTPEVTTPGGHARWSYDSTVAQLREIARRDRES